MDNAQLYLSLVRPSMIPVVGESADDLFIKQIEVTGWRWGFHNLEEQKRSQKTRDRNLEGADRLETSSRNRDMQAGLKALEADMSKATARRKRVQSTSGLDWEDPKSLTKWIEARQAEDEASKEADTSRDQAIRELYRDSDAIERAHRDRDRRQQSWQEKMIRSQMDEQELQIELEKERFSFSFTKRIDLATTQMLNSMKAGDIFPLAIFTMHQYSANNPMSLVIKIEGLRLQSYSFAVDTSDTMTDLKEEWTCDFKGFSYVYQNRRSFAKPKLGGVSDAKQIAVKGMTQGTVRAFVMLPRKF